MDCLIMCIGNRGGGDDAIGPYIADNLKKEKTKNFAVLDCGTMPENYTSIVKQYNPKNLTIIDAVEMGLNPGEMKIVPKKKISKMHISTHGIPISVLIGYLEQYIENVLFIGIQPKTMSGEMTTIVRNSGNKLIELIKTNNLKKIETLE